MSAILLLWKAQALRGELAALLVTSSDDEFDASGADPEAWSIRQHSRLSRARIPSQCLRCRVGTAAHPCERLRVKHNDDPLDLPAFDEQYPYLSLTSLLHERRIASLHLANDQVAAQFDSL